MGRPWLRYWLFPYPNTMGVWPQFRSPLMWDVFAVSTYATVSVLFWFIGLIPDFATCATATENLALKIVYGMLSLGLARSARHWHRYETAYLLLAGLATPLVLSVHTVVSFDFAVGIVPGWHTTIFPPYFVAGAIYSGFAMVLMLAIPIRKFTAWKISSPSATCKTGQGHAGDRPDRRLRIRSRSVHGWYSGDHYDAFTNGTACIGPYGRPYWMLLICNIFIPQILWIQQVRTNPIILFLVSRDPGRHVAGAFCHRRHEPAPRLPHVLLGHVLPHALGLDDVHRHHRHVPHAHVPVLADPACDFDLRDAHPPAGSGGERVKRMMGRAPAVDTNPRLRHPERSRFSGEARACPEQASRARASNGDLPCNRTGKPSTAFVSSATSKNGKGTTSVVPSGRANAAALAAEGGCEL